MYVVTGGSSHTATAVANALLEQRVSFRMVGRNSTRLQKFVDAGVEVIEAEPFDDDGLAKAFSGAEAAFVMLQPGLSPEIADFDAFQINVADSITRALRKSDVKRIIALSGWGANYPYSGTPLRGLRYLESALSRFEDLPATFIRAGWFMENLDPLLLTLAEKGSVGGPLRADLPLPMITTADIGHRVAELLSIDSVEGHRVLELQGPSDRTLAEAIAIAGPKLGRPDAKYQQESAEATHLSLLNVGFSSAIATEVVQMASDVNERRIRMLQPRSHQTATSTTLESYIESK